MLSTEVSTQIKISYFKGNKANRRINLEPLMPFGIGPHNLHEGDHTTILTTPLVASEDRISSSNGMISLNYYPQNKWTSLQGLTESEMLVAPETGTLFKGKAFLERAGNGLAKHLFAINGGSAILNQPAMTKSMWDLLLTNPQSFYPGYNPETDYLTDMAIAVEGNFNQVTGLPILSALLVSTLKRGTKPWNIRTDKLYYFTELTQSALLASDCYIQSVPPGLDVAHLSQEVTNAPDVQLAWRDTKPIIDPAGRFREHAIGRALSTQRLSEYLDIKLDDRTPVNLKI